MYPTGQQQYDDQRRAKHLDGLEKRDDAASVGAIRERAAGQGQRPDRRVHGERIEPDQERGGAQAQQQPGLGDLLRPASDIRQQRRQPEGTEPTRRQQPQRQKKFPTRARRHARPARLERRLPRAARISCGKANGERGDGPDNAKNCARERRGLIVRNDGARRRDRQA